MESHPLLSRSGFLRLFAVVHDRRADGLTDSWRSAGAPSLSFTFSFSSFFPLFFLLVESTSSSPLETYEPERRCVSKCAHVLSLRVE